MSILLDQVSFEERIEKIASNAGEYGESLVLQSTFTDSQLIRLKTALESNSKITSIKINPVFRDSFSSYQDHTFNLFLFLEKNRAVKKIDFRNPNCDSKLIADYWAEELSQSYTGFGDARNLDGYLKKRLQFNIKVTQDIEKLKNLNEECGILLKSVLSSKINSDDWIRLNWLQLKGVMDDMQRLYASILQRGGAALITIRYGWRGDFIHAKKIRTLELLCEHKQKLLNPLLDVLVTFCKKTIKVFLADNLKEQRKAFIREIESLKSESSAIMVLDRLLNMSEEAKRVYAKYSSSPKFFRKKELGFCKVEDDFSKAIVQWFARIGFDTDKDMRWLEGQREELTTQLI